MGAVPAVLTSMQLERRGFGQRAHRTPPEEASMRWSSISLFSMVACLAACSSADDSGAGETSGVSPNETGGANGAGASSASASSASAGDTTGAGVSAAGSRGGQGGSQAGGAGAA